MRVYESIYILQPDQSDEEVESSIDKINKIVEKNGGKILDVEKWGKRRLAYEVANEKYGIYVLFHFEAEPKAVKELERNYRLLGEVNKYIILLLTKKELARLESSRKEKPEEKTAETVEKKTVKKAEETEKETVVEKKEEEKSIETKTEET